VEDKITEEGEGARAGKRGTCKRDDNAKATTTKPPKKKQRRRDCEKELRKEQEEEQWARVAVGGASAVRGGGMHSGVHFTYS